MGNQERRVQAYERQKQALALRLAGVPYDQIAEQLGYAGANGAWKAVNSALKRTIQEPADAVREVEIKRLDAALMAVWSQVKQGNLPAVDRFVKLAQRRADLLGLDAPKKTDITSNGNSITFVVQRDDGKDDKTPPNPA